MSRARNGSKSSGNNQNLVTILFVLGIIGWGFFAIDRLTEGDGASKPARSHGRALGQEAGWKKSARDWLNAKLSSGAGKKSEKQNPIARNVPQRDTDGAMRQAEGTGRAAKPSIPIMAEPEGLKIEEGAQEEPKAEPEAGLRPEDSATYLFYRLNQKGQPVLTEIKRKADTEDLTLKARIAELIKGPSAVEQDKDYIDSFIRKPRILGAQMEGRCAVVNFDKNFGAGVSYQTLRFQIRQIYRNVELWQHANCLELRIGGKYTPYLGTDGMFFPKRIDQAWFKQNL